MNRRNLLRKAGSLLGIATLGTTASAVPDDGTGYRRDDHPGKGPNDNPGRGPNDNPGNGPNNNPGRGQTTDITARFVDCSTVSITGRGQDLGAVLEYVGYDGPDPVASGTETVWVSPPETIDITDVLDVDDYTVLGRVEVYENVESIDPSVITEADLVTEIERSADDPCW